MLEAWKGVRPPYGDILVEKFPSPSIRYPVYSENSLSDAVVQFACTILFNYIVATSKAQILYHAVYFVRIQPMEHPLSTNKHTLRASSACRDWACMSHQSENWWDQE